MIGEFSDYVVFVDESGDHSLSSIDEQFPVFCLAFCVIKKREYIENLVPSIQRFKFKYWGHDAVVLHEHEIRKTKGDFGFLRLNSDTRVNFNIDLHSLMIAANFSIVATVIDKKKLKNKYVRPWNPYEIAVYFGLERLLGFLLRKGEAGKRVHVIFECRGKAEDHELELVFRRIIDGEHSWGWRQPDYTKIHFEPKFVSKSVNSTGLQLADLTARPIALRTIRPTQNNRAFDVIQSKFFDVKQFP